MAANKEAIKQKVMERQAAAQAAAMAKQRLLQEHQVANAENAKLMMTPMEKHEAKMQKLTPTKRSMKEHQNRMKKQNILKGKK